MEGRWELTQVRAAMGRTLEDSRRDLPWKINGTSELSVRFDFWMVIRGDGDVN